MYGLQTLKIHPKKVFECLKEFELFCLGETKITPEKFKNLNKELSVSAVLHIGRRRVEKNTDGKHLIWISPDQREHDLGSIHDVNVFRDYPGFNRTRSLSLGHDQVVESKIIGVPPLHNKITVVKLKDGSTGIGPNYKMALRNASLKMHLKKAFEKSNPPDLWKMFYGNA